MSRRPSLTGPEQTREARGRSRGQTLAEFGITISLLIVLILGIFQVGYLIYQQYIAINLAREGANLALREKSLDVVESAIRSARPDFDADTKLILSVVELGPPGGPTAGDPIITQRHAAGTLTGASVLGEPPPSSYGAGPTYTAKDLRDSSIRARAPLPNSLTIRQGQSVYVAEIYLKRRDITPLAGVQLPNSLYSVAYF